MVIRPSQGWISLRLGEIWEYRELLYFLVWRDVKVRYKQTILGAAWAILQPLMTMVVFTIFFGRLAKVGSDGLPYPLFSYAGLLPWTFFAQGLASRRTAWSGSANLIKKVYFPRLVIPASPSLAGVVDFVDRVHRARRDDDLLPRLPDSRDPLAAPSSSCCWRSRPRSASGCGSRR